jgi:hypothetical protein
MLFLRKEICPTPRRTLYILCHVCAGMRNRSVGRHNMNDYSSRSHTILTVHITSEQQVSVCKFFLCWPACLTPQISSGCVNQIIPINNLETNCFFRGHLQDRCPPHTHKHRRDRRCKVRTVTNSRLWYARQWVEIHVISVQKDIVFYRPYPVLTNQPHGAQTFLIIQRLSSRSRNYGQFIEPVGSLTCSQGQTCPVKSPILFL